MMVKKVRRKNTKRCLGCGLWYTKKKMRYGRGRFCSSDCYKKSLPKEGLSEDYIKYLIYKNLREQ